MSLILKEGVSLRGVQLQTLVAMLVAEGVYRDIAGTDCVVTSCNDSQHMAGSLHYAGKAVDFRLSNVPEPLHQKIHLHIKTRLGAEFDILLEDKDGIRHLHAEYDPKT